MNPLMIFTFFTVFASGVKIKARVYKQHLKNKKNLLGEG